MTQIALDVEPIIERMASEIVRGQVTVNGYEVQVNLATIATYGSEEESNNRVDTERQVMRMRLREFYQRLKVSGHV